MYIHEMNTISPCIHVFQFLGECATGFLFGSAYTFLRRASAFCFILIYYYTIGFGTGMCIRFIIRLGYTVSSCTRRANNFWSVFGLAEWRSSKEAAKIQVLEGTSCLFLIRNLKILCSSLLQAILCCSVVQVL